MGIIEQKIEWVNDVDNNQIIYALDQETNPYLRNTNPYALNRQLLLIGQDFNDRLKKIEEELDERRGSIPDSS